ncbi:MAG TPA: 3'-5' exonuclease [Micropepsaceae bacterium]|nr:3'-5' exonuclease [Micropepsaceae bacterium]
MKLVAIDFETANHDPGSACAVAVAVIENRAIRDTRHRLIRPPTAEFVFTYIHGIDWPQVAHQPEFAGVWAEMEPLITGADYLLAHNAPFDRRVLMQCCRNAGRSIPPIPFLCTVRIARDAWGIYPTKLPDVCRKLRIPLNHHDALSDATACAKIAIAAMKKGHSIHTSAA